MAGDAMAATVILDFLLVFLHLTIQLVGNVINRCIQIRVNAFDEDIFAGYVQCDFRLLVQLLDAEHDVNVDDVIEMTRDFL